MAKAKDAYYFSHDANARHDPKIVKMLTKYKYGYQWYFMIVEILREQSTHKYKIDEYAYNAIGRELCEDPEQIKIFIEDCIKIFNLFLSDGEYFWSSSLLKRMKIKSQKSKLYSENAKKRWNKTDANSKGLAMQLHSNGNALNQIKSKEKKGKESSVSESTHALSQISLKDFTEAITKDTQYLRFDMKYYYEAISNHLEDKKTKVNSWVAYSKKWMLSDLKNENAVFNPSGNAKILNS